MPKPIFGDNGSGMHSHQSLWKGETNLFWDEKGYGQISETAKYYIGGLLKHAAALLAICAPTTNSYRRLVPGYEAPVNLVYSQRNRSAAVRIPIYSKSPKSKRIEFRCPDPSTNPYLCFAAQLMAGLDGIQNKIDPGEPIDKDLYDLEPEEAETGQEHARIAGRGARRPGERPRLSAQGRRLHAGRDRDLDHLQAGARARPDQPAAGPLRVLPLLRPVSGGAWNGTLVGRPIESRGPIGRLAARRPFSRPRRTRPILDLTAENRGSVPRDSSMIYRGGAHSGDHRSSRMGSFAVRNSTWPDDRLSERVEAPLMSSTTGKTIPLRPLVTDGSERSIPRLSPNASAGKRWRFRRNVVICVAHRNGVSRRLLADVFVLREKRISAIIREVLNYEKSH